MENKIQKSWDVMLYGVCIDTVFYLPEISADEVLNGLINHDGYNPDIKIREGK